MSVQHVLHLQFQRLQYKDVSPYVPSSIGTKTNGSETSWPYFYCLKKNTPKCYSTRPQWKLEGVARKKAGTKFRSTFKIKISLITLKIYMIFRYI